MSNIERQPLSYFTGMVSTFVLLATNVGRRVPRAPASQRGSGSSRSKWRTNVSVARFLFGTETSPSKPGQRGIPGGKRVLGESLAQAACRETFEETGIRLDFNRLEKIHFSVQPWYHGTIHNISFWGYILSDSEIVDFHHNPPKGDDSKNPLIQKEFTTLADFAASSTPKVYIAKFLRLAAEVWFDEVDAQENGNPGLYKSSFNG